MQIVIHVACYRGQSLRAAIGNDPRIERYGLHVTEQKRPGRSIGWSKIHSTSAHGVINMEWDAAGSVLICRVVTKGGNPGRGGPIFGAFLTYLMSHFRQRIQSIHVVPVRAK